MRKEEEQRFKKRIRAEYKMRFLLPTDETKLHTLRMAACRFDPDLKEAHQNQLRKFSTELSHKPQEMLQKLSHLGRENLSKQKMEDE